MRQAGLAGLVVAVVASILVVVFAGMLASDSRPGATQGTHALAAKLDMPTAPELLAMRAVEPVTAPASQQGVLPASVPEGPPEDEVGIRVIRLAPLEIRASQRY
jgi:hypothetical protein